MIHDTTQPSNPGTSQPVGIKAKCKKLSPSKDQPGGMTLMVTDRQVCTAHKKQPLRRSKQQRWLGVEVGGWRKEGHREQVRVHGKHPVHIPWASPGAAPRHPLLRNREVLTVKERVLEPTGSWPLSKRLLSCPAGLSTLARVLPPPFALDSVLSHYVS